MSDIIYTEQGKYTVSVVIPTLGGDSLAKTIEQMNSGTIVPTEILVCIPEEDSFRVSNLSFPNLRIIKTDMRGQVAQRAKGFHEAKYPLVLQLDDDISLQQNALYEMVNVLTRLGPGHVVGPVYFNIDTGLPLSPFKTGLNGFLTDLYQTLVCALPWGKRRMGALSSIATCASVDPRFCFGETYRTQWLSGGCVMGYSNDLIMDNFFNFQGKAFAEDVLHSHIRNKNDISHHVALSAKAKIDQPENIVDASNYLKEIIIRLSIVRYMKGSYVRAYVYIFMEYIRRVLSSVS